MYTEVINNPLSADYDHSNSISVTEGIIMGLALSADSVFTGIGAGISGISLTHIFLFSLLFGAFSCTLGMLAGKLLNRHDIPAGRIAGLILIIMAFTMH